MAEGIRRSISDIVNNSVSFWPQPNVRDCYIGNCMNSRGPTILYATVLSHQHLNFREA